MKDFRNMTKEEKERLFVKETREEIAKHHAAGRYTVHGDGDRVYQLYSDGHKEYIE